MKVDFGKRLSAADFNTSKNEEVKQPTSNNFSQQPQYGQRNFQPKETKTLDPFNTAFNKSLINEVQYSNRQRRNMPMRGPNEKISRCTLLIYSPRDNQPYMVRPSVYNFNQFSAIDAMLENHTENNPILNSSMFEQLPELNGMILPSNEGHIVDLRSLNDCWTFTLIVDSESIDGYQAHQTTCKIKTISTGFCLTEPINPNTRTPNPDAIFKFSHHTRFRFNKDRGGNYYLRPEVVGNYDVVPTEFKSIADQDNEDIVNLSPQYLTPPDPKIFAQKYLNDNSRREDFEDLAIDVFSGVPRHSATKVHSDLKSSKKHLATICTALDQAKDSVDSRDDIDYHNITSSISAYQGCVSTFDMFYKKLSDQKPIIDAGITGYEVKSFKQLMELHPKLDLKVVTVRNPRTWEVSPGFTNNPNNKFNAWISTFLNQFCEAAGIMELIFAYDSYCGNQFEREGRWQVTKFDSIYGDDKEYGKMLFHSLRKELEGHIFNFLRHMVGDFTLFVTYRSFADTAINLQFYGEEVNHGFFETPTDKPGLITPLLGDKRFAVRNNEEVALMLTRFDID